ncbi:hypothetical protein FRC01_009601 [Tulasnella sp. 417]|nr:hypothetical protein FRC01_009601 [Tulasnella sp. 417]
MHYTLTSPSTPQRGRSSASNALSPLSRHQTPLAFRTPAATLPQTPSQTEDPSLAFPLFNDLPPPPSTGNVVPNWLNEHIPLFHSIESELVLAALIGSRAPTAAHHRNRIRDTGNAGISWDWYIKEITRRKVIFNQVTGVMTGLCALLELTTDATVFLYCCRTERAPSNPSAGRDEVIYHNARGLQHREGAEIYSELVGSAQAFADYLSRDWIPRQRTYDSSAIKLSLQTMKRGVAAHRPGDFPPLARFDSEMADQLLHAISSLSWPSFGLSTPLSLTPSIVREDFSPSTQHTTSGLGHQSSAASTSGSSFPSLSIPMDRNAKAGDKDDIGSPSDLFVGRRALQSELRYMNELGLTELQEARVRLALWETHPDDWYNELQPFFTSKSQVLFLLLGALLEHK